MWQEDYLKSLTRLPEALDMVGVSTELLSVSFAPNDQEKWDHSFARSIVGSIPTMVEILEDTDFFLLLNKFSNLLKGLQTAGLLHPPSEEQKKLSEEGVLEILSPVSRLLVMLSPWKTYLSFSGLRDFLEEMEDDWEGPTCVEYLALFQQVLEELELWKTLVCFKVLHDFLTFHHPSLTRWASRPETHEKLGPLNFFPTLVEAKEIMDVGMEFFHDCLADLHAVLHNLNRVEAIVPYPDDLGIVY